MKLTGTYNGKPIELELTEEQVEVLKQGEKKKTGWERAEKGEKYFVNTIRAVQEEEETGSSSDNTYYRYADYFIDEILIKNILTAQHLQRKLWRRSAELCKKMNLRDSNTKKYYIAYDVDSSSLYVSVSLRFNRFGEVYFDTKEHAEQVMDEFHNELIWYFTQFRSRMD